MDAILRVSESISTGVSISGDKPFRRYWGFKETEPRGVYGDNDGVRLTLQPIVTSFAALLLVEKHGDAIGSVGIGPAIHRTKLVRKEDVKIGGAVRAAFAVRAFWGLLFEAKFQYHYIGKVLLEPEDVGDSDFRAEPRLDYLYFGIGAGIEF